MKFGRVPPGGEGSVRRARCRPAGHEGSLPGGSGSGVVGWATSEGTRWLSGGLRLLRPLVISAIAAEGGLPLLRAVLLRFPSLFCLLGSCHNKPFGGKNEQDYSLQ